MRRRRRLLGAAVVITGLAVALGLVLVRQHTDTKAPRPLDSPNPAAVPAPAPRVGSCHRLSFAQAAAPTAVNGSVRCSAAHTSVTIFVGRVDPLVDGHLLATDSAAVQAQLARRCPRQLSPYAGGSRTTRRLSRLSVVWFGPTVEQADLGARWFRCDLVALAGHRQLAPLSGRMRDALDRPGALARWGTCGTAAPDAHGFSRVICSEPHRWRTADVVGLPKGARFLGQAATATANSACKDVASNHANGALKFTWSFEWPTRAQWDSGQRYGYCWLPTT